jgi:hypothetical protein
LKSLDRSIHRTSVAEDAAYDDVASSLFQARNSMPSEYRFGRGHCSFRLTRALQQFSD